MLNFIRKLDADSDALVMATMKKEYGYLLQMGALFLNLRPKWWILSILHFLIYLLITLYFLCLLIKTAATTWENDMSSTSQSAHFASLAIVMLIILLVFIYHRRRLVDLMRIVGSNYYKYTDGFQSEHEHKWKAQTRKLKIALLVIIPLYFFVCVIVCMVVGPIIDRYQHTEDMDANNRNQVYTKVPVPLVFPYEINTPILHYLTVISEMIGASMLAFIIAGGDLSLIFLSQDVAVQLKILRDSIKKIEDRALSVYYELYNINPKERTMQTNHMDDRYMAIIKWCLKQNVEHHKIICRGFGHLYHLVKWPLGAAFLFGSAVIALSVFTVVTSENSRIAPQLLSLLLLAAEVWNMLMICWIGQQLTDISGGLSDELYNLKWRHWNRSCILSLLIFRERLKRPLVLRAAGLTPINMEMFGAVMNTSYSYFNLIFAYTDTTAT